MKIKVNYERTKFGNGIKEGSTMRIEAKGASHISGAIYKKGLPVLAIFGYGGKASIKVKRYNKNLKGAALLKVRAFDKYGRGFGIDDIFQVV